MSNIRFLDQVSIKSFDPTAPAITKGDTGETGARGPEAYLAGWRYDDNGVAGVDIPASGSFILDQAWSSTTSLLSLAEYSTTPTNNWSSILDKVSVGAIIKLADSNDPATYKYLEITSKTYNAGYYNISVNQLLSAGTLLPNEVANASFQYFYDSGTNAFPYTGSADISGSLNVIGFSTLNGSLTVRGTANEDIASFRSSNNEEQLSLNSEGVMVFKEQILTPTAVSGGMMYSSSAFWFGL